MERETCMACDGVGWVEGGETIKTTCKPCDGTGEVPGDRALACPGSPAPETRWFDTARNQMMMRNEANTEWIEDKLAPPPHDPEGELMEAVDAGVLELRRVAQVVVWESTGECPLRCQDCLKTHGPGPVVMVFDQQGGQVQEFTGNWIELRGPILSAVFQHKGQHSVELHLGVPYGEGAEAPAARAFLEERKRAELGEVGP